MNISKKHEEAISSYIRAKDNNKPHLMGVLFADSASLTMEVRTDKIAFPSETNGLRSIKEKESIRIGFGEYKWTFNNDLVSQLTIIIEKMIELEKDYSKEVFSWVHKKAYPWCDSNDFLKEASSSVSFLKNGLIGKCS